MKAFVKSLFLLVLLCLTVVAVPVSAQDCFDDAQDAFEDGDYEDAAELFTCAIDDDPENYEAYLGRANSYLLTGSLAVQTIID
jgi:thioredoxin-like negative regulator of GroEL